MVVASKSHRDQATDDYIGKYAVRDMTSAGSSLKFCLVATGEADLYPRLGRTMEWDTAAGHAVLPGAGGRCRALRRSHAADLWQARFRKPVLHRPRPRRGAEAGLSTMSVLIVIPARYASTRYPGKPLVELRGAGGAAQQPDPPVLGCGDAGAEGVDRVVVATDDDRIRDAARGVRRRGGDDLDRLRATAPSAAPRRSTRWAAAMTSWSTCRATRR